jgi:hypothetical protein
MRKDTVSVEHARERTSAQRKQTSSSFFLPHLLYLVQLFKPPKINFQRVWPTEKKLNWLAAKRPVPLASYIHS